MHHQNALTFVSISLGIAVSGCSALFGLGVNIPAELKATLEKGSYFELVSLNPDNDSRDGPMNQDTDQAAKIERLQRWEILGQTPVTEAAIRAKLISAIERGAMQSDGTEAKCFNPRHAIRVQYQGVKFEIVICFECKSARIYKDGVETGRFLTTNSPQPTFDAVLRDAGVPLPKPAHGG